MRQRKILYVIWSLDLGGAEQVVMNLARHLNRTRFEPLVCCLNGKGRYASLVENCGIRVFELHKQPKLDLFVIPKLIRLIREEKIDLVHTHLFTGNFWGRIAARLAKVPVVSTEHNVDSWKSWFHLAADRFLVRFNERIIFVSDKVKEFYGTKLPSLNGKGQVLHNGIDTNRFQNLHAERSFRSELQIDSNTTVIGMVGRLVPQKGFDDFLRAIKILRDQKKNVVGLIVGDGPLRSELEAMGSKMGLENHVLFSGFCKEMERAYQAMDVFILSSLREGFPLVVLEAMACGVPVVATRVGGVEECVDEGESGFLVPVRHPEEIADAVQKIIDDQKIKETFIKQARKKVENHFSIEKMVQAHELLYEEVLAS